NGNQVGSLLCYYLLSQWKEKNSLPKKPFMVKTIVSTDLPDRICEEFNVELDEVLTGFKYIAQKVYQHHDVEGGSRDFLYGFEESYGYNLGDFVRDKDAVSACLMISEMAAYCKKQGKTLLNYLDEVYERYGYYIESLKSLTLKGKEGVENIAKIMDQFRNKAPESIAGSKVVKIRDVKLSRITDVQKGVQEKIDLPVSNVITFYLKNSGKVTLRPSGTEPKIKFYFSFALRDSDRELEAVKSAANKELQKLEEDFLAMVQGIIG
ncbi:MAG: phospho-sugar mutase, partial [Spirochaetota bacterium]|nr:phospho-sugar mutase [Spirochaetota bacterium]